MTRESLGDRARPHTHTQKDSTSPSNLNTAVVREVGSQRVASTPAREAQNETDPLRRMWDALTNAGCHPHGETYKFRARCPVHQGNNIDALEVYEGSDRRAVFGCYAHRCDKGDILNAVGLRWADMFPPGHHKAQPRKPSPPKRDVCAGALLLDHAHLAGYRWRTMVVLPECPYCGNERALLWVHDQGGLDVECPGGCNAVEVRRAVETRAAIAEQGVQL